MGLLNISVVVQVDTRVRMSLSNNVLNKKIQRKTCFDRIWHRKNLKVYLCVLVLVLVLLLVVQIICMTSSFDAHFCTYLSHRLWLYTFLSYRCQKKRLNQQQLAYQLRRTTKPLRIRK